MSLLHLDLESRSTVDLKKRGVYVYGAHPSTDVLCAAYAIDDESPKLWVPRQPIIMGDSVVEVGDVDAPAGVEYVIKDGYTIVAHNANFERVMWNTILGPRYHWPIPKLEQWECTMVQAMALSLPAALKNATRAVGIEDGGKEEDGRRLMLQMCKPRAPRKGENPEGTYWFDDEARRKRLGDVCKKDVVDERELHRRLLRLRPDEQRLWQLDQIINDRGVYVDIDLCYAARKVADTAAKWLNDEMRELTNGAVEKTTCVAELTAWCAAQDVHTDSLDKDAIEDLLGMDLPPLVRRVLEIRLEAAKAAVKKIDALIGGRNDDGRARGLLQFHAAGTGRWAGRRFQPQNIKRPELEDIDGAIATVSLGSAELVKLLYGEPLATVGDCLRGLIIANKKAPWGVKATGNKLLAADFSNIEGRIIAWLAGEAWKVAAFEAFDAGTGHDIYHLTAGKVIGRDPGPVSKPNFTKKERQEAGKVPELALGYQGGVKALLKKARELGVEMTDARAEDIKVAWRNEHPHVTQYWQDLVDGAMDAVENPGKMVDVGRIRFRVVGNFLFMRLPGGRCIAYPYPRIKDKKTPWGTMRPALSYKGVDTYTHQWTDCYAHGGLLFNNAVQGTARDIEKCAMERLQAAGYETGDAASWGIVLTCHDEIVAEVPLDFGSIDEFKTIMVALPAWAPGLPIAATGWSAQRYHK